jgi:hypothetical protein
MAWLPAPVLVLAVLAMLVAACGEGSPAEPERAPSQAGNVPGEVAVPPTTATRSCDVGGRPDYFVPGGDDGPFAIIGCARLGVSGKPVEFSADYERIGRKEYVCLNPAYRGRGQLGIYIPATCRSDSMLRELRILKVEVPRQAVRGYALVIWGTMPPSARELVAHYQDGRATAAVLRVDRGLARKTGATRPFSVFIVELPIGAACHPIEVQAIGSPDAAREQLGARPKLCGLGRP